MSRCKEFLKAYKLPILSGFLIGTTYIPFPPWASLFCLVPLWIFWMQNQDSLKKIFLGSWITQFLLTLIGFNWVGHTLHEFGPLPWALALLGLLGFCTFANLHFALAGIVWQQAVTRFRLSPRASLLLLPLSVAVLERTFPMIFDWHFGYTWYWVEAPMIQTAEIWGFRFLSAYTIFFNLIVFYAVAGRQKVYKKIWLTTGFASLVALNAFGWLLQSRLPTPDAQVNVLVIQANIGNLAKQIAEAGHSGFRNKIINEYKTETRLGLANARREGKRVDFALWPETAFPDHIVDNKSETVSSYLHDLMRFLKAYKLALVTGAYGYNSKTDQTSNSLVVFNEEGQLLPESFKKTVLLAFGEYFPGANWFPILLEWFPQIAGFERGKGPRTIELDGLNFGPQICYEGLFDWFSRESSLLGSQVLVNVTNDSWYGTWQQPYQHLYMTLARAIETRLPIIRSTNTGITTVGLASGEIMDQSPLHVKWNQLYEIPYRKNPEPTFFVKYQVLFILKYEK